MDGDRQRGAITVRGGVHSAERHDSAHKHVTGAADYIDDMAEPVGTLHAYLGLSEVAHAEIASIDLSAVRAAPGVVDVLTAADIPAVNDVSPVHAHDDPVFAEDNVMFWGQPVFAVIAESREQARRAAALARARMKSFPSIPRPSIRAKRRLSSRRCLVWPRMRSQCRSGGWVAASEVRNPNRRCSLPLLL